MSGESDFNTVMSRLKAVTKSSSDSSLAELLGISSSAFANFKKRNSIPYDRIFAVTNSLNISFDWVLTGNGAMHRQESESNEAVNETVDREAVKLLEMLNALPPAEKRDALMVLESKLSAIEQKRQIEALMKEVVELRQKVG